MDSLLKADLEETVQLLAKAQASGLSFDDSPGPSGERADYSENSSRPTGQVLE